MSVLTPTKPVDRTQKISSKNNRAQQREGMELSEELENEMGKQIYGAM